MKRYGCIFTCLTVRAVHIEVAQSLEADSFINAFQHFICRRGQPLELQSDNGTNFVGGYRELWEAVQAWINSKLQEFMRQKEVRWRFNPPAASHMGGVWEHQIRNIRKLLSVLMNQQQLTDELLQTSMHHHHHHHLFAQNTIKIDNGYVNEQDRKAHCALTSAHNIT